MVGCRHSIRFFPNLCCSAAAGALLFAIGIMVIAPTAVYSQEAAGEAPPKSIAAHFTAMNSIAYTADGKVIAEAAHANRGPKRDDDEQHQIPGARGSGCSGGGRRGRWATGAQSGDKESPETYPFLKLGNR